MMERQKYPLVDRVNKLFYEDQNRHLTLMDFPNFHLSLGTFWLEFFIEIIRRPVFQAHPKNLTWKYACMYMQINLDMMQQIKQIEI